MKTWLISPSVEPLIPTNTPLYLFTHLMISCIFLLSFIAALLDYRVVFTLFFITIHPPNVIFSYSYPTPHPLLLLALVHT